MADALVVIFDGVQVDQHDDGSADSMYDLDLTGPLRAAVEVGRITESEVQRAAAHWRKQLTSHETVALKWHWIFMFNEDRSVGRSIT